MRNTALAIVIAAAFPFAFIVTGTVSAATLAAGATHTCVVTASGGVRCWGNNATGQLGRVTTGTFSSVPLDVPGLTGVIDLAAGERHTCALTTAGVVKCWGDNSVGQLGDSTVGFRATPADVPGFTESVVALGGSAHTTCGIVPGVYYIPFLAGPISTRVLKCWGGTAGGTPTVVYLSCNILPPGPTLKCIAFGPVRAVSSGSTGDHICASLEWGGGLSSCWGPTNSDGQLGNGQISSDGAGPSPRTTGFATFATGARHTCAPGACWGYNGYGQLGIPPGPAQPSPVPVAGLGSASAVALGSMFSCALRTSGEALCWGRNDAGQLGDGTTTDRSTPAIVLGVSGALEIAAGADHGCAHVGDFHYVCWGGNAYGQLGDGSTSDRPTPVPVPDNPAAPVVTTAPETVTVSAGTLVSWTAISAGNPVPVTQWQYSDNGGVTWIDIAEATSSRLSFAAAVGESGRRFRAVFSNSAGTAATPAAELTVTSDRPFVGDFDGDSRGDLIVWRPNTGTWYALLSSGGYDPSGARLALQWGDQTLGDVPLLADIDGDGRSDVIVWRASTGTWFWLTSSSGYSSALAGTMQWGNASLGDVPLAGDVDGDGKADLIVWRASTGTWYWLTSASGYQYALAGQRQWGNGLLGDAPILGDIDGDGKVDLTVWRASTGTWYWLTSSTGYVAAGSVQWGSAAYLDSRFLRDIDGDGRADFIVWRPGNGTWYWLTSSSGYDYASAGAQKWGSAAVADTPLAATLDADGRADLAVWRPDSGTWFCLLSSRAYDHAVAAAYIWGSARPPS